MMPDSFAKIFSELESAVRVGVIARYGIGGAIGATFYIEAAETEDVDVFVAVAAAEMPSLDPFRGVYEYFLGRGARWQDEHLVMGGWPVHLLPSTGPLLDDAMANAQREVIEGQPVCVLSLEHLGAIALETNRGKDRARLQQIWDSEKLDRTRFLGLVERFGLQARWEKLSTLFEESE